MAKDSKLESMIHTISRVSISKKSVHIRLSLTFSQHSIYTICSRLYGLYHLGTATLRCTTKLPETARSPNHVHFPIPYTPQTFRPNSFCPLTEQRSEQEWAGGFLSHIPSAVFHCPPTETLCHPRPNFSSQDSAKTPYPSAWNDPQDTIKEVTEEATDCLTNL